eukprot:1035586-Amphidinium_carterae.1
MAVLDVFFTLGAGHKTTWSHMINMDEWKLLQDCERQTLRSNSWGIGRTPHMSCFVASETFDSDNACESCGCIIQFKATKDGYLQLKLQKHRHLIASTHWSLTLTENIKLTDWTNSGSTVSNVHKTRDASLHGGKSLALSRRLSQDVHSQYREYPTFLSNVPLCFRHEGHDGCGKSTFGTLLTHPLSQAVTAMLQTNASTFAREPLASWAKRWQRHI